MCNDNGKDVKNKNKKPKVIENEKKNNFFSYTRKLNTVLKVFIDQYTNRDDFNEKNKEINKAVSN